MHRLKKGLSIFKFALHRVVGHLGYVLASLFLAMVTVSSLVLLLSLAAMVTELPVSLPFVSSVSIDPAGGPAATDISPNGFLMVSGVLALAIYGAVLQALTETTPQNPALPAGREVETASLG